MTGTELRDLRFLGPPVAFAGLQLLDLRGGAPFDEEIAESDEAIAGRRAIIGLRRFGLVVYFQR